MKAESRRVEPIFRLVGNAHAHRFGVAIEANRFLTTQLSGGEKTLTATALLFAIYLIKPAPFCILDEVDAPLDDANVDRFCKMLHEMRSRTDTRFIVITHNPVTMSRMDRLYGVTMPERGMSQLVSVDLKQVETLVA